MNVKETIKFFISTIRNKWRINNLEFGSHKTITLGLYEGINFSHEYYSSTTIAKGIILLSTRR